MPNIYSGVCLTALFSTIVQEHNRLKSEVYKLRTTVEALARPSRQTAIPSRAMPSLAAGRS
jgi:hypothetical protein